MEEGETSNLNYNILYVLYLAVSLYYSLIVVNDYLSNLVLFITLLTLTSVFKRNQKKILVIQALITFTDLIVKTLSSLSFISVSKDLSIFNDSIVRTMVLIPMDSIKAETFVYIGLLFLSWILPFTYRGSS